MCTPLGWGQLFSVLVLGLAHHVSAASDKPTIRAYDEGLFDLHTYMIQLSDKVVGSNDVVVRQCFTQLSGNASDELKN